MSKEEQFFNEIKDSYLKLFGDDEPTNTPFALGSMVVLFEMDYLEGEESFGMLRTGSRLAALGMAREAIYWLLPNEDLDDLD